MDFHPGTKRNEVKKHFYCYKSKSIIGLNDELSEKKLKVDSFKRTVGMSKKIKLKSLIMAQIERWRQA